MDSYRIFYHSFRQFGSDKSRAVENFLNYLDFIVVKFDSIRFTDFLAIVLDSISCPFACCSIGELLYL